MTTPFNPNAYWLERGKTYAQEPRLHDVFYREQEEFVADTVRRLNPASILEVGCGAGRITRVMAEALPTAGIDACDISADQLTTAWTGLSRYHNVRVFYHDLYNPSGPFRLQLKALFTSTVTLLDESGWDLTVAIEVFLHHPTDAVRGFVERLLAVSSALLHEWDPAVGHEDHLAEHCFYHDYDALYRDMGLSVRRMFSGRHALMLVTKGS